MQSDGLEDCDLCRDHACSHQPHRLPCPHVLLCKAAALTEVHSRTVLAPACGRASAQGRQKPQAAAARCYGSFKQGCMLSVQGATQPEVTAHQAGARRRVRQTGLVEHIESGRRKCTIIPSAVVRALVRWKARLSARVSTRAACRCAPLFLTIRTADGGRITAAQSSSSSPTDASRIPRPAA